MNGKQKAILAALYGAEVLSLPEETQRELYKWREIGLYTKVRIQHEADTINHRTPDLSYFLVYTDDLETAKRYRTQYAMKVYQNGTSRTSRTT